MSNSHVDSNYFDSDNLDLAEFDRLCRRTTDAADFPAAVAIEKNVLVYDGAFLRTLTPNSEVDRNVKSELARCLKDGPGVLVVRQAYADTSIIDRSTEVLSQVAAHERTADMGQGDHFGDNERVWNSLQKACLANPSLFVEYYGNPVIRVLSEAWLGPAYRVTAQINNIRPGGQSQSPHRDYHLGFQSASAVAAFPAHTQVMSQFLTLQGAIAHCDMSIEMGPTMVLPWSQLYPAGYQAYHRIDFAEYFRANCVQLPLEKGDMIFFSPAVFHAGGANTTTHDRVANLLQISSAFGRTMESIDHDAMIRAVYPELLQRNARGDQRQLVEDVVAIVADGYSFPTNLDWDPPNAGNAPTTQQQMVLAAIDRADSTEQLAGVLDDYRKRRTA